MGFSFILYMFTLLKIVLHEKINKKLKITTLILVVFFPHTYFSMFD